MVQGTWYGYVIPTIFLGAPVAQPAPTKFGTKVVIVTYSPHRICVPNLKLLASTVAEINRGSQIFISFCFRHKWRQNIHSEGSLPRGPGSLPR